MDDLQRTDEWFSDRIGKLTASRIADATARTKTGWGASRKNYMAELIAERLTGNPAKSFSSAAMEWGTETELEARAAYEFARDVDVELVGFVDHPKLAMTGASPDGLIGTDGLVEIKCPNTATHIDTLLSGKVDKKYIKQMHWQMACTGRKWCDFVSYDPRLPEEMKFFCKRVFQDESLHMELHDHVEEFLSDVDEKVAQLRMKFQTESEAA